MGAKEGSKNFIIGVLVGAASWLPGISGGIVAVIFGIYERLIDDVTHIRKKIREDFWFLAAILSGIVAGLLAVAYFLDYMMNEHLLAAMFLFVGLILGQLPSLMKITKRGEPTKAPHIIWLALGFAVMISLLFLPEWDAEGAIMDSALYIGVILSFVVGLIFAVSKIVPGISASTLLLALGLFYWMNSTVLHFDLLYLVPFGLGFIVAVALFSKVMWHLIENHHHPLYYFIVGLTLGSIIVILATDEVTESWDALGMNAAFIAVAAAAIGLVVSLAFGRINSQDDTGKAV